MDIVSKDEFEKFSNKEKLDLLISYKGKINRKDIAEKWGVKPQYINDLVFRLKKQSKDDCATFKYTVEKDMLGEALLDFIEKTCKLVNGSPKIRVIFQVSSVISVKPDVLVDCDTFKESIKPLLKFLSPKKKYTVNLSINDM
jgi:transposase-like protein